jgi:hypothetical protein
MFQRSWNQQEEEQHKVVKHKPAQIQTYKLIGNDERLARQGNP